MVKQKIKNQKWLNRNLLFAVNGIYTAIIESAEPALAASLIADGQRGTGYGMLSTVKGLGYFPSSIIVGVLWSYISPAAGLLFGEGLVVLTVIIIFCFGFPEKNNDLFSTGSGSMALFLSS